MEETKDKKSPKYRKQLEKPRSQSWEKSIKESMLENWEWYVEKTGFEMGVIERVSYRWWEKRCNKKTRDLALASMARNDPPASSTASSTAAAAMRGKVGSEFET